MVNTRLKVLHRTGINRPYATINRESHVTCKKYIKHDVTPTMFPNGLLMANARSIDFGS